MSQFKHHRKFPYFFMLLLFFTVSCREKYLWFTGLQGAHNASEDRVLRVYFDRYGDVYPPGSIYIHPDEFMPGTPKSKLNKSRLETYFTTNTNYLHELAAAYHYSPTGNNKTDYDALQLKVMADYRKQLEKLNQQHQAKQLVVFVHGFNDPDPTGTYQELRSSIKKEGFDQHQDFVYLEVYWDGLTANGGSPGFAGIWGKAQLNSRYVCLGLRKLLNQMAIPDTLPMTVITHSLGASVGTGMLFNTHSKWRDDPSSFTAKELAVLEKEATPKMSVRLGMLAPAIPGVATFMDIFNREPAIAADQENINRIVVSVNPGDYALDKGTFRKSQFMAPLAGATTLGSNYQGEAEKVRTYLQDHIYHHPVTDRQYQVIPFNTKQMPKPYNQFNEHGLHYYLRDTVAIHSFIQALFK